MVNKKDRVIRRNKKPRPKKVQSKGILQWLFIVSVLIFLCVLIYIFLFSSFVSIHIVDVNGVYRVHKNDILDHVNKKLEGKRMWYIENNNYFFVDTNKIIEEIKQDQRIKSVVATKKFPDKITFDIVEYDVVPIWCNGSMNGTCFELDQNGCVVRDVDMNSPLIHDNQHFIVVDHGHTSIDNGQCVISDEKLRKIQFLGEELIYALNVGIKKPYIIDFRGSGEIKFDTDESWYVLVDLNHSTEEVLHIAGLFAKKIELPSRRADLEYVDLRFPEKMFYKMREGVEQEEENEDIKTNDGEGLDADSTEEEKDDK